MGPFADGWQTGDVEAVLARGLPDELLYVPLVVAMAADRCDPLWAENVCLELAVHAHFTVRGNAALGFGHIARTCRALSTDRIVPAVASALQDPHPYVRGQAESAASDIHQYLGVVVPGYKAHSRSSVA
jgi:hypothetical protein